MADELRRFRKELDVSTTGESSLRNPMTDTETKSVSKAQPSSGASPLSFAAAFRAARNDPDKPKTFSWKGKSFTTEMAGEKKSAPARSAPAKAAAPAATPKKEAGIPAPAKAAADRAPASAAAPEKPSLKSAFEAAKSKISTLGNTPRLLDRSTKTFKPTVDEVANQKKPQTPEQRRKLAEAVARSGTRSRGLAKGGKIDGCAVRGKTKAGRK